MKNFKSEGNEIRIHLTNISGVGATKLMQSLLPEIINTKKYFIKIAYLQFKKKDFIGIKFNNNTLIKYYRRYLPNSISRFLECTLFGYKFNGNTPLLVLGDMPIRCKSKQIVFLQNTLLLKASTEIKGLASIKYWLLRNIFKFNLRYVTKFIVQTESIKLLLVNKYPGLVGKVIVISQPAPSWLLNSNIKRTELSGCLQSGLNLFYPAAFYPHKNHKILSNFNSDNSLPISKIILTIPEGSISFHKNSKVECLGMLDEESVLDIYKKVDSLLFLSLTESLGFPLIEAMSIGIPIICSDLEYSRLLCGDQAIYFEPNNINSLEKAINSLHIKLADGWWPDWSAQLRNVPYDWESVAKTMIDNVLS